MNIHTKMSRENVVEYFAQWQTPEHAIEFIDYISEDCPYGYWLNTESGECVNSTEVK